MFAPFLVGFALCISDGNADLPQHLLVDLADRCSQRPDGGRGIEIKDCHEIFVVEVAFRLQSAAGHQSVSDADGGCCLELYQFSQTNISHYLDTASFTGFFCHLVSGAQLLFNLNRSQVCSCSLMFNGFQLHFVGKSPFTGEQIFSLQIAVNHNNCGSIVIQVAHNDRHGFFSGQFAGSAASVTGYQLITAIRQWSGNRRNQHTILFDAVCGFYHCIIILDLEGVILERMQFR